MNIPKEHKATLILVILVLIIAMWVVANYQLRVGAVYLGFGFVGFLCYVYWNMIFKKKRRRR